MRTIQLRMAVGLTAALFLGVMPVTAQVIVSQDFHTAPDPAKWTLSGNAIGDPATQTIILTAPGLIQAGSIFWSQQLSAEAFAVSFDLWIGERRTCYLKRHHGAIIARASTVQGAPGRAKSYVPSAGD